METETKFLMLAAILVIMFLAILVYCGNLLRSEHSSDIRVIFFFYSLTIVITSILGVWAVMAEVIDDKGNFIGDAGNILAWLVGASLNIKSSLYVIVAITISLIMPQILNYILSGLFGVATSVIFFSESYSFAMWWVVKTFVVAAGVTTVTPLFAVYFQWDWFNQVETSLIISLCLLSYSFMLLGFYRKGTRIVEKVVSKLPQKIRVVGRHIHNWCRRADKAQS